VVGIIKAKVFVYYLFKQDLVFLTDTFDHTETTQHIWFQVSGKREEGKPEHASIFQPAFPKLMHVPKTTSRITCFLILMFVLYQMPWKAQQLIDTSPDEIIYDCIFQCCGSRILLSFHTRHEIPSCSYNVFNGNAELFV